jgi:hypothetical protein
MKRDGRRKLVFQLQSSALNGYIVIIDFLSKQGATGGDRKENLQRAFMYWITTFISQLL